jgi:hypothetical protein
MIRIVLEVVEEDTVVYLVEIDADENDPVEAVAHGLANLVGVEVAELLEELTVDGEKIERHRPTHHYHRQGHHWRHRHRRLRVIVFAPRAPEPKVFFWMPQMLVEHAAALAAKAFGYAGGHPGLQTDSTPPRVLDNKKTLEAEHVRCGSKLELIDSGGGVCAAR